MASRPTTVQELAIREAVANGRIGDATTYSDRTLDTMLRNGWITRPDTYTYRITPAAARIIGQFTLADTYLDEDLLMNDPKARRQAAVVAQAAQVGIAAFAHVGATETVMIRVEDLAELLAIRNSVCVA